MSGILSGATISARAVDTAKGTVALLRAPSESVARSGETAQPTWVVFPQFESGATTRLESRSKADTLIELGRNAFNYSIHGKQGFDVLSRMVDECGCFTFTYSRLSDALATFNSLPADPALVSGVSG